MSQRQTIGTVAKAAGVNVETIRFYERKGLLLQPKPISTSFREYPQGTVERIRFVKRAQELGFTLAEIIDLLNMSDGEGGSRADVKELADRKLGLIRQKIDDLRKMETTLRDLVDRCSGQGDTSGCPIIEALTSSESPRPEKE